MKATFQQTTVLFLRVMKLTEGCTILLVPLLHVQCVGVSRPETRPTHSFLRNRLLTLCLHYALITFIKFQ